MVALLRAPRSPARARTPAARPRRGRAGRPARSAAEARAAQERRTGFDPVLGERPAGVADRLEPVASWSGIIPVMEHRRLGEHGPELSAIGLGLWLTYGGGVGREETGRHARGLRGGHHVLRHRQRLRARGGRAGVGRDPGGLSARLVRARDEGLLPDGVKDRGLSRAQILKQIDASLSRLRVDYVDLIVRHRYDDAVHLEETMGR